MKRIVVIVIACLIAVTAALSVPVTKYYLSDSDCRDLKRDISEVESAGKDYWEDMNVLRKKIIAKNLFADGHDYLAFINAEVPVYESFLEASSIFMSSEKCFPESKQKKHFEKKKYFEDNLKKMRGMIEKYMAEKTVPELAQLYNIQLKDEYLNWIKNSLKNGYPSIYNVEE